jgi:hypothetical protein
MREELTSILPCTDLVVAQCFFERLGFLRDDASPDEYRMLHDASGGHVHLVQAVAGWLDST